MKQSQMRSLGKTSQRNHRQLFNYIWNNKPLKKYDFIFHADDFVALDGQSEKDRFFEGWIESYLDSHQESYVGSRIKVGFCPTCCKTLRHEIVYWGLEFGLLLTADMLAEVPEDRNRA
jgi:hypothetical protein